MKKQTPIELNPTDQPITTSPPPTPANWWKITTIILTVVLAAGGFYLLFSYKQAPQQPNPSTQPVTTIPSPDPTTDWKSYSNSIYSLKFPLDMTMAKDSGSILVLTKWGPTQKKDTELYDGISLKFEPREMYLDLESFVNLRIEELTKNGVSELLSGPESISVNGYSGLSYTTKSFGINRYIILESKIKYTYIIITDNTLDPGNLGFSSTVDQILATFKFITQEAITIKPWYDSGFATFSIQFPSTWSANHKNDEEAQRLIIERDGHKIIIYQQAFGGSICLFNDSPEFEGSSNDLRTVSFEEIIAKNTVFRFFKNSRANTSKLIVYDFCQKEIQPPGYFTTPQIGILNFETPIVSNPKVFEEMKQIIASIQIISYNY